MSVVLAVGLSYMVFIMFKYGPPILEKEMTTHSSILAWKISWTEEPGGVAKSQSLSD